MSCGQVKRVDAGVGYGGDWTVRIVASGREADGVDSETQKRISLMFYVADEDVSGLSHLICLDAICMRKAAARKSCERGFVCAKSGQHGSEIV